MLWNKGSFVFCGFIQMVNTGRSEQGDGSDRNSKERGESQNPANQPDPKVRRNIVFDEETMETLKNLMLQTIQSVLPAAQNVAPEVEESGHVGNIEVEYPQELPPVQSMNFSRALKTFLSMKPDSYDGTGEPVKIAYWFSHIEQLMENISCTESQKVRIAALHLKEGATEWWKSIGLSRHQKLS